MPKILNSEDFFPENWNKTLSFVITETNRNQFALVAAGHIPPPLFHNYAEQKGFDLGVSIAILGNDANGQWKIWTKERNGVLSFEAARTITRPLKNQISDLAIGKSIKLPYHDTINTNSLNQDKAEVYHRTNKYGEWLIIDYDDYEFLGITFD
jgi:hypothetical protein